MKNLFNRGLYALAGLLLFAACADDTFSKYETAKPQHIADYEYLNAYDALKSYIDRSANPNFKLGVALSANDFTERKGIHAMAVGNFDEIVAGNDMKYSSVVGNNGAMNFTTIINFVKAAKAANMTIYGHTLGWHSQQNNAYLGKLIADRIDENYVPILEEKKVTEERTCIIVRSGDMAGAAWDTQFWISTDVPFQTGDKWSVSMSVRADKEASAGTQTHTGPGGYIHWAAIGTVPFTTEWTTYTAEGTITAEQNGGNCIAFNLNDFAEANNYYFDDISFKLNGVETVVNGNCDDLTQNGSFYTKEKQGATEHSTIVDKYEYSIWVEQPFSSVEEVTCIKVESDDMVGAAWDTQFWIAVNQPFQTGDTWSVSMSVRAAKEASAGTQTHIGAGGYIHWAAIGTVPFTREWTTYTAEGTISSEQNGGTHIAFNLNDFAEANTYYFDNISFKLNGVELIENGNCDDPTKTDNFVSKEKRGDIVPATIVDKIIVIKDSPLIPLTPEEKKDTLTWAMDNWIKGMMEATGGYVTAWDAVNEPIAGGGDDGEGFYPLQSATNVSAEDAKNNFYWQDYLGSVDYVRIVIAKARQYFEEYGGNPSELKLFINDYNLESDWDDNKKLKSMINWIKKWEADDVTKIDGIGTQMHISCYANTAIQESKKAHITKMFELMAATGKLVKVSELDMGYVDADGNSVKTEKMTLAQHKEMSELYQFVVSEYFRIIPAAQRYGITQWCATDSPASSSWRAGEPVGLWDLNYNRKPAYGGFAEGLAEK